MPRRACCSKRSTLTTTPSVSYGRSWRCSRHRSVNAITPSMSSPASRSGFDGEAEAASRSRAAGLALDRRRSSSTSWYEPGRELAAGRHRRVLLAQGAGAAVARVGVQREAQLLALGVDPRELRLGHVHLAPGLERRAPGGGPGSAAIVRRFGGDVLAGACRRLASPRREPAALVAQRDREAVDLQLGDVGQVRRGLGCGGEAQATPDPGVERAQLVVAEGVRQGQHRPAVADLGEPAARRRAADLLGRRVGRDRARGTPPRARPGAGTAGRTRRPRAPARRPRSTGGSPGGPRRRARRGGPRPPRARATPPRRRARDRRGATRSRCAGHASPNWSTAIEAMWSPIASDAVAAGDGALRTWITDGAESNTKSSTRSPAGERA